VFWSAPLVPRLRLGTHCTSGSAASIGNYPRYAALRRITDQQKPEYARKGAGELSFAVCSSGDLVFGIEK